MTAALVITGILVSCGGGGGGEGKTEGQKLIDALTGTHPVNVTSSNVTNVEGTPDLTGTSVTLSGNSDDTGMTFTLSGSTINQYFTGGSFSVSDAGSISGAMLDVNGSASITISSVSVSTTDTTITISAVVAADVTRGDGVGNWTIVFDRS